MSPNESLQKMCSLSGKRNQTERTSGERRDNAAQRMSRRVLSTFKSCLVSTPSDKCHKRVQIGDAKKQLLSEPVCLATLCGSRVLQCGPLGTPWARAHQTSLGYTVFTAEQPQFGKVVLHSTKCHTRLVRVSHKLLHWGPQRSQARAPA